MDYLERLKTVNSRICNCESKYRLGFSEKDLINQEIGKLINEASDDYKCVLTRCLQVSSLIKLYQPFEDGNHRTGLVLLYMLLNMKGYTFDLEVALTDMKEHRLNLPTIYEVGDAIGNIDLFDKYVVHEVVQEIK